jgi:threonine dehydrogenase-like Zn-dependent dehydrogenase
MKALILRKPGELVMGDAPMPAPGSGELLIRTKAATICTSDLTDIQENPFGIQLPVILGHEGAGVVRAVGHGVTDWRPGDEVTAHPVIPCYACASCQRGLPHLCDDMGHLALDRGGVFAEYFCIRQDRVRRKPEAMPFTASTLMEPVCVCLEALEQGRVAEGANVLIIGDGPFGILTARLAKRYRPAKLILLGRHPYRLTQAEATAINTKGMSAAEAAKAVLQATDGGGIDTAIVCVTGEAAVDTAVTALRSRGTLSLFAALGGKTPVDLFRVHIKELNIRGSCNDMDFLDKAMACLSDPALDLGGVITHTFPFAQWQCAFHQAAQGKSNGLKVSMTFE